MLGTGATEFFRNGSQQCGTVSAKMKSPMYMLLILCQFWLLTLAVNKTHPLVVITWEYREATTVAWSTLYHEKRSALDAVEESCKLCESMQCRGTVGFGGSPDENGETTLDALIMDGVTMDVGGVGGLRRVKNAISVARRVLENTEHSLLGGDLATDFAMEMGFQNESLQTEQSLNKWKSWRMKNCQPNYWKNVAPDPARVCGPFHPLKMPDRRKKEMGSFCKKAPVVGPDNHDTIGVVAIDLQGNIAAGTSTNGAIYKIPGRIGDSPIAGAGAYADAEVGAAAATGTGDIMMRFLPTFLAVEEMRRGASPKEAATTAVHRIAKHYPKFSGAVIALHKDGRYGAACNNLEKFPFFVANPELGEATPMFVSCIKP